MKLTREQVIFWAKMLSTLDVLGLALILIIAFGMQFFMGELPCPLCLLQRLGILAIGFGFLLNIHYHIRTSHYAISLLAAVFTALVSMRQVLLHIVPTPGDYGYGSAIFGLHMYTWVFIISIVAIIYIAIVMSWPAQYVLGKTHSDEPAELKAPWARHISHFAFLLFFIVTIANVISLHEECGWHECPDNPIAYVG